MGIDGIGKFPVSGTSSSVGAAESTGATSKAEFTLPTSPSEAASGVEARGLLEQLQSGQITRDQYLDLRVDEAVKHLEGQLSPEKLDIIRSTLRDQLSTDPLLLTMVRRAIGDR